MPATRTAWSEQEDEMLRAHYAERGPSWAGWREVLNGRTRNAIISRAKRLGLQVARKAPSQPREFEAAVGRRMASGMTPSQIDREMHWPEGRAASITSEAWRRDKERA